jgi:hypothetical protein
MTSGSHFSPAANGSLTERPNQPMFRPGPLIAATRARDLRREPGSIHRQKEILPFAAQ